MKYPILFCSFFRFFLYFILFAFVIRNEKFLFHAYKYTIHGNKIHGRQILR